MLEAMVGWTVIGIIIALLIGAGFSVLSMNPPRHRIAEICYSLSAMLLWAKFSYWAVTANASWKERAIVAFLVFGISGTLLIAALGWVEGMIPKSVPLGTVAATSTVIGGTAQNIGEQQMIAEVLRQLSQMRQEQKVAGRSVARPVLSLITTVSMVGQKRTNGFFWVLHRQTLIGPVVSPAPLCVFMGVVNNTLHPTMIASYYVEVRNRNGQWTRLDALSTVGTEIYTNIDPRQAYRADRNQFFDKQIEGRMLKPGEPALGWALFEYPPSLPEIPKHAKFKVVVKDTNGLTATRPMSSGDLSAQGASVSFEHGAFDLTQYRIQPYSDALRDIREAARRNR